MNTAVSAEPRVSLRTDRSGSPFRRVLIANRGEIAVRIIRACRDLGVETVAVYSDADASALHVRMADSAIRLGPAPAAESYLRGDLVVAAAIDTNSDAIHPGYGFLSERASFARDVIGAGIAFIGPDPAAIEALGDKVAARRSAHLADVPVVPGTFEPVAIDGDLEQTLDDARRIGFPLLVKAAAGGGGRGMRRVAAESELRAALVGSAGEAVSSFGDGAIYLEREIRPARHVEVQLLGDQHGCVVALGERDCSIQRRHQKLIEESPAPGLSRDERQHLHGLAIQAARAASLSNAATAEFLFDSGRKFWFLEVNARLQVEHGITEAVTGIDLVTEQLWIAAGAPLSERTHDAAMASLEPRRHALEVRLSAEDPARAFAPAPGRVRRWVMPSGPGVRVDTSLEAGDRIPAEYDPMVAKIITVGSDRKTAIDVMNRALSEIEVTGVQTTLPFHRHVMNDPSFARADLSTDWVTAHWDGPAARAGFLPRARLVAAQALASAELGGPDVPAATGQQAGDVPGSDPSLRKDADGESGWCRAGRLAGVDRWPG
ncbi:MAG: biotin carboxylase N-terminal domain-containing protein [Candidatus Limnocylindrales bacterium]